MIIKFEGLNTSNLIPKAIYKGGTNGNAGDEPLIKLFKMEGFKKGIGASGGFRKTSKESNGKVKQGTIAFVVLVDTGKKKNWPNYFDEDTGIFTYYGDNETIGKDLRDTKNSGNELLEDIFKKSYSGFDDRNRIPPVFIFKSTGKGRDTKFIGLAVPGVKGMDIEEALELRNFDGYDNYVAKFTVLNISSGVIDRDWLKDLKDLTCKVSDRAPREWNDFVLNGLNNSIVNQIYEEIEVREEVYESYNNEVERKIKVRVTQGKFRDSLLKRDKKCVICGLDIESILVASHIKPWSQSNDYEKQDENNGLLLCANHDALFDKGYISFDSNGSIIISSKIDKENYDKLSISTNLRIKNSKKQSKYMDYHRKNILNIKK